MRKLPLSAVRTAIWLLGILALWGVLDHLSREPATVLRTAAAQATVESACGDANGDERIDISDAIYIINWALRAGPELACPDMQECIRTVEELEALVAQGEVQIAEQREQIARQEAEIAHCRAVNLECEARSAQLAAQLAATQDQAQKLEAQLAQAQQELEQCRRDLLACEQP
jgi:hypothetical protein